MDINDLSAKDKAKEVTNCLLQLQPEVQRPLWSEEDLEQWFEDPHPKPRDEESVAEEPPPLSPVNFPSWTISDGWSTSSAWRGLTDVAGGGRGAAKDYVWCGRYNCFLAAGFLFAHLVTTNSGRLIIKISSIFLVTSYLVLFGTLIWILYQFIMYEYEDHVIAWTIGGAFVLAAVPLSLQDIHFHVLNYVSPLQRHYIRILWMIPIYAIESWLALRFNHQKIYLETMRETYEAYVVYSFFKLMREFLGSKEQAVARMKKVSEKSGRKQAHMLWPCCCVYAWRLDGQFLTRCSLGIFQYVVIRTVCATLALIFEQFHLFGEGHYDWNHFYIYYVFIVNISQCWALYCLVLFYHELKDELKAIRPLPKFLIVKAVVFFSWWQNIIIAYLAAEGYIITVLDYSAEDVGKALQNLLICVEMLIYGAFYHNIFSYKDFKAGGTLNEYLQETHAMRMNFRTAMKQMLPTDVLIEGKGYVLRAKRFVPGHKHKTGHTDRTHAEDLEMRATSPGAKSTESTESGEGAGAGERLEPAFVGKGQLAGEAAGARGAGAQQRHASAEMERQEAIEAASSTRAPRSRSAEPGVRGEGGAARHAGVAASPPVGGPMPLSPRLPEQERMGENGAKNAGEGRWG